MSIAYAISSNVMYEIAIGNRIRTDGPTTPNPAASAIDTPVSMKKLKYLNTPNNNRFNTIRVARIRFRFPSSSAACNAKPDE